jgi:hypothetical protein
MKFTRPELEVLNKLAQKFDEMYELDGEAIRSGTPVNLILPDNSAGKLQGEQWREYLRQRSAYEGWIFTDEKLQIRYLPENEMPVKRGELEVRILDPYAPTERGYRKRSDGLYQILSNEEREHVRDNMAKTWHADRW